MKENMIIRELKQALGTKEDDIIKTLERFSKDIEENKKLLKKLE